MALEQQNIDIVSKLTLHQSQRNQSIPTLSVLVGKTMMARELWSQWLSNAGRQAATCVYQSEKSLFEIWLSVIFRQFDGRALFLERVAAIANQSADQTAAWLNNASDYELQMFWQRLEPISADIPVLQQLLSQVTSYETVSAQSTDTLSKSLKQGDRDRLFQSFTIVTKLLPPESVPGILVWLPDDRNEISVYSAVLALLVQLAESVPILPLGLLLTEAQEQFLLKQFPESRVKAVLRSGLLRVDSPQPDTLKQWFRDHGAKDEARLQNVIRAVAEYGVTSELLETALALTETADPSGTATSDAKYRSQAERFLFHCLEARASTAGQFQLNTRLDIEFGNRSMEVDFLAEDAKVVVELDGYYHFRSLDNYRRDRRKDALLQQQGFLILRFLADDVVNDLETILATIEQTLALR